MIRTVITRVLSVATMVAAMLAIFAAPSLAHFGYTPISKFGIAGSGDGQFDAPVGVAIDEGSEDVYVVDQGNNRVEQFGTDGKYLSTIDGSETPAKAFDAPTYIAVDNSGDVAKGHVYVADPSQGVVDVFDSFGKYMFQIKVEDLRAITTDTLGHLWVWTSQTSFEEYSEAGALLLRQPISRGTETGVVVDSSGNVYVLYGNGNLSRFSPPSYPESEESGLSGGRALAIDPDTNEIFQDDGSSIIQWPAFGEGPGLWERTVETFGGMLGNSHGIAFDGKTGSLYASDESTNDVEVFRAIVTPDVTTGSAGKLTIDSATVEGTVNPDKVKTTYFFEWGETESYGHLTTLGEAGEGEVAIPVNASLVGLEPKTTYHYRIVASNESGSSRGLDGTFTTLPLPPIVEGVPTASNPTRSGVVLRATVNANGRPTTYDFAYVEAANYEPTAINPYGSGGQTVPVDMGSGAGGQVVEQLVEGLRPNTTYHYRVIAANSDVRTVGTDGMFMTGAAAPPVTVTGGSSGVVENGATVSGVVGANGLPTSYGFEIGTSTDYGPATGLGSVGAGAGETPVSLALFGLVPGTTYHYRLTASNVDGTSYGADETFTTSVFASTFATPPAPLPFVEVPSIVFPTEPKAVIKKSATKKKPKKKRNAKKAKGQKKAKGKRKAKGQKKK